jgi:hypothetical protein
MKQGTSKHRTDHALAIRDAETMQLHPIASRYAAPAAWLLVLAMFLLTLAASPALAAPQLSVQIERDAAEFPVVSHSDERIEYTVQVENEAAIIANAEVGETLTCDEGFWLESPTFTYQWTRNGVPLESAEDIGHGSQSEFYELQPADAGQVVQCRVTGTNAAAEAVSASNPPTVVAPAPSPAPPSGT